MKKLIFLFFLNAHAVELNKISEFAIEQVPNYASNWLVTENKCHMAVANEFGSKYKIDIYSFDNYYNQVEKLEAGSLVIDYTPQCLAWFKSDLGNFLLVIGHSRKIYIYKLDQENRLVAVDNFEESDEILPYIKQVKINNKDYLVLSTKNKILLYLFNSSFESRQEILNYDGEILSFDIVENNKGHYIGLSCIRSDGIPEICVHHFEAEREILVEDNKIPTIASLIDNTQGCLLKWISCGWDYYLVLISNKENKNQEIKIYYYDFSLGALFLVGSSLIHENGCSSGFEVFCSSSSSFLAWSHVTADLQLPNLKIFELDFSEHSKLSLKVEKKIGDNLKVLNSFSYNGANYLALIKETDSDRRLLVYHFQQYTLHDVISHNWFVTGSVLFMLFFYFMSH